MTDYTTAEEHLPVEANRDGEITLQVTDTETKEIFVTRARIARSPETLDDPEELTVVRGPHENIHEQWYIEVLGAEHDGVDRDRLRDCVDRAAETNVVNARSEELRALLAYLVETGEYESVSAAVRTILADHLAETHPDLLEAYVEVRTERERTALADRLGQEP